MSTHHSLEQTFAGVHCANTSGAYLQAEGQPIPRMSAAYGFIATPAGPPPRLSQPAGAGLQHRRSTLSPAGGLNRSQHRLSSMVSALVYTFVPALVIFSCTLV